jgi:hypothetical protein
VERKVQLLLLFPTPQNCLTEVSIMGSTPQPEEVDSDHFEVPDKEIQHHEIEPVQLEFAPLG